MFFWFKLIPNPSNKKLVNDIFDFTFLNNIFPKHHNFTIGINFHSLCEPE